MKKMLSCGSIMLLFLIITSEVFAFPYPNAEIRKGELSVGTGIVFNLMGFSGTNASDSYMEYGMSEKIGILFSYDDAHRFAYDDAAIAAGIMYKLSKGNDLVERGKGYSAKAVRLGFITTRPTDVEVWALSFMKNDNYTDKLRVDYGFGFGYPTVGNVPHQLLVLVDAGLRYQVIKDINLELSTILIYGLETEDRRGEAFPLSFRLNYRF